jgi:TatD DNase family protein
VDPVAPAMLIDSHCHLDYLEDPRHGMRVEDVLLRAAEAGVGHMLSVAVDRGNIAKVLAHAAMYSQVSASVGIHPGSCADSLPIEESELLELAAAPSVVAIGETGLDYHYGEQSAEIQRHSFAVHLRAASRAGLPVIVHTREAVDDTLRLMEEHADRRCGGVMHCFTESVAMALAAIEMNFFISFSGIVTFRSAGGASGAPPRGDRFPVSGAGTFPGPEQRTGLRRSRSGGRGRVERRTAGDAHRGDRSKFPAPVPPSQAPGLSPATLCGSGGREGGQTRIILRVSP